MSWCSVTPGTCWRLSSDRRKSEPPDPDWSPRRTSVEKCKPDLNYIKFDFANLLNKWFLIFNRFTQFLGLGSKVPLPSADSSLPARHFRSSRRSEAHEDLLSLALSLLLPLSLSLSLLLTVMLCIISNCNYNY